MPAAAHPTDNTLHNILHINCDCEMQQTCECECYEDVNMSSGQCGNMVSGDNCATVLVTTQCSWPLRLHEETLSEDSVAAAHNYTLDTDVVKL